VKDTHLPLKSQTTVGILRERTSANRNRTLQTRRSAFHPLRTFQQLRTNSGECLHSNYREAAWNDRHGRIAAV
jgi:hypothetical protein